MAIKSTQLAQIKTLRWRARTDLLYLSQLLGYDQLTPTTHGPVIDAFQKFPSPNKEEFWDNDVFENGKWHYRPLRKFEELPGQRRLLLLDSRGFAKSTINLICHSTQWILNYPDIAMLLMQANLSKVQAVLKELKSAFQYNENFRALFPEHCPKGKVADWGKMNEFTTEARRDMKRKEPTVIGLSLGAGTAGLHFHVMKFSDIVEHENSQTPEQIARVVNDFDMCRNLLDRPDYWIDVEGTRYNYADLYGKIMDAQKDLIKAGKNPEWKMFTRGCYKKDISILDEGLRKVPKYTPDELECPDLLDDRGLPISNWPEKFTVEFLEMERTNKISPDSELTFASQRRNNPMDVKDSAQTFAPQKFTRISRENFFKVPKSVRVVTVDTASTQKIRSNYTAITTGVWSQSGKLYIDDVIHGKFLPEEIVFHLFNCSKRYTSPSERPQMYFIEKTAYVDGLMPTINRAQDTGKLYIPESLRHKYGKEWNVGDIRLPITLLPRETTISKQDRIRLSLQTPYASGDLVFLDDIPCLEYLQQEFFKFPQFHTDDIIDTIADQYQNKEWFGRLQPRYSGFTDYMRINREKLEENMIFGENLSHAIPVPGTHDRWGGL